MEVRELKKYIFKNKKINDILLYYKFHDIWENGEEIRCATPDGDNRTSISIKNNDMLFAMYYSSSKPYKGDLFGLIQSLTGRSFKNVLVDIHALLGLSFQGRASQNDKVDLLSGIRKYKYNSKKITQNKLYDKSFLNRFVNIPHADLYQEAILPSVAKKFDISYDPRQNRLIFPHYDWNEHDKIVGVQGRIVGLTSEQANELGVSKYWNYIKGYKKSLNLFGWNHTYKNVEKSKKLILFEAEKSTLKHYSYLGGEGYAVSLGGHEISEEQVAFIVKNTPQDCEIIIAFDKDIMIKDKKYLEDCCKMFSKYRKSSYVFDIIDNGKILKEKDSPIDNGFAVFEYLIESRITVD